VGHTPEIAEANFTMAMHTFAFRRYSNAADVIYETITVDGMKLSVPSL
jgi:hypothetical protein